MNTLHTTTRANPSHFVRALRVAAPLGVSLILASPATAQDGIIFGGAPESHPMGSRPGLCRLELRFPDGDQHLRTMQAIPSSLGTHMLFDLADNDHAQAVNGTLRWWDLTATGSSIRFASISSCRNGCWISIPRLSASQELVLAGIDLRYLGTDRHVRDIEVWPEPENARIWVRLRDNSTDKAFSARIAYVLIPRYHHVRWTSSSTGDESADINRPKAWGKSYIQGFSARFRNGDHHFQRLWVDVCSTDRVLGTFHDNGGVDDPYRLDVRYVTYQPIY